MGVPVTSYSVGIGQEHVEFVGGLLASTVSFHQHALRHKSVA
jgi:hypothetical protein